MWKDSYKIGNEIIDAQHKELFSKVEKLLGIVSESSGCFNFDRKQECIDIILFLKDYAIQHFAAEEELQVSLKYTDIEMHKIIHGNFVLSVLEAEQDLIANDFSLSSIKKFCGFLTAWLVYHVAGADQKIINNEELSYNEMAIIESPEECYMQGIEDVFSTAFGEKAYISESTDAPEFDDYIKVNAELDEIGKKEVVFAFSKETALSLVNSLTNLSLTEVDELAYSVLCEMSSIIGNKAVSLMPKDRNAPKNAAYVFNTSHGKVVITAN